MDTAGEAHLDVRRPARPGDEIDYSGEFTRQQLAVFTFQQDSDVFQTSQQVAASQDGDVNRRQTAHQTVLPDAGLEDQGPGIRDRVLRPGQADLRPSGARVYLTRC